MLLRVSNKLRAVRGESGSYRDVSLLSLIRGLAIVIIRHSHNAIIYEEIKRCLLVVALKRSQ